MPEINRNSEGRPGSPSAIAQRFDNLLQQVHPPGEPPMSLEKLAKKIRDRGHNVSRATLGYLRSGEKTNPTVGTMQAIAEVFGVPVAYFFDDATAEAVDAQLALLTGMGENRVQLVAFRRDQDLTHADRKNIAQLLEDSWAPESDTEL